MKQIIILTTLLINLISCNSQGINHISNFDKLNKIQIQIEKHLTNEKTYKSLDSLKNVVDGADAELYAETYKNIIINDTENFLNYIKSNHKKIDENVITFFEQDEKTFKIINEKLKRIDKIENPGYIKDYDGYTNLRKEGSKNSEIIQKVNTNAEVEILKGSGDWFLVKTNEGNIGYVHKSRISRKKFNSSISPKWIGNYYVDIPTTREYLQSVKLKITLDSCVFIVTGFAENKEYELSMIENDQTLILKYVKLLKYESSYIEKDIELAKEKEFGYLIHNGKKYLWISPYLDSAYYNGEKHKHIIKKIK
ncbi:MAG: SH3 domain-containing protein [Flavobacterium sp.]